jgi:hypothetical protein
MRFPSSELSEPSERLSERLPFIDLFIASRRPTYLADAPSASGEHGGGRPRGRTFPAAASMSLNFQRQAGPGLGAGHGALLGHASRSWGGGERGGKGCGKAPLAPWAAALSSAWAGGWLGGGRWRGGGARALAAPCSPGLARVAAGPERLGGIPAP